MGVVMERWCPTQQMLGLFLRRDGSEETCLWTCGCSGVSFGCAPRQCSIWLPARHRPSLAPTPPRSSFLFALLAWPTRLRFELNTIKQSLDNTNTNHYMQTSTSVLIRVEARPLTTELLAGFELK